MEQATETPTATPENEYIAWPDAMEYGGAIWNLERRHDSVQYRAFRNSVEMRVYLYPDDSPSAGRWLWQADFRSRVPTEKRPAALDLDLSDIVPTLDDAMACCINAFDEWLDSMQSMLLIFRPEDQYAQGFRAGQEDIKAKVAEVVL